jgi:hypothetical protein
MQNKKKTEPTPEYRKGGLGFYPGGLGYNSERNNLEYMYT